ncbi:Extracellular esterase EstB [Pseudocercospora fuligena]|uniref:Extracellular esterase EstB n=1 Tax=Pseudocercospora fuligena TaxID=685502 RepID=A0A8H6R9S0_9PEZI|nr:Extracellular esterase EstB [Pseudocercospora fuligena]
MALRAFLLATLALASPVVQREAELVERQYAPPNHNDFSCRSTTHPNPVVLFHGLGATYYEDLNQLETYLKTQGFCTFSITYGAYPQFPYVGGLKPIADSAAELATFIREVKTKTGASKIDFVGHSEGAFQTLYVPKFESGISSFVQRIIAIAPPTHGTTFANLYTLSYIGGNLTNGLVNQILNTVGCAACADVVTNGPAVQRLNSNGPIVQSGNQLTVLASKYDELVTPTYTAFVNETGVKNYYIQDFCPNDPVGHIGEAYDRNVWAIVKNTLSDSSKIGPDVCAYGSPGR